MFYINQTALSVKALLGSMLPEERRQVLTMLLAKNITMKQMEERCKEIKDRALLRKAVMDVSHLSYEETIKKYCRLDIPKKLEVGLGEIIPNGKNPRAGPYFKSQVIDKVW